MLDVTDVDAAQSLQQLVRVEPAAAETDLHEPRPNRGDRRANGDGTGGPDVDASYQSVAGPLALELVRARSEIVEKGSGYGPGDDGEGEEQDPLHALEQHPDRTSS